MRLLRRLQFWIRQRRHAAELEEEMEFHRQMAESAAQSDGATPGNARTASRRTMGNTTLAREAARQVWIAPSIESVFQDLRYGVRSLLKQPSFTILAVCALALGIGVNTTVFTLFNAIALRPWPVKDPGRVYNLSTQSSRFFGGGYGGFSFAEYKYLRDHSHTMDGIFLMRTEHLSLDDQADGPTTVGHFVSGNYFSVLGVNMFMGRAFQDPDDNPSRPQAVVVLSYRIWQNRFGSDRKIIGRQVRLDEVPFTVIGVAGEDFIGTSPHRHDLWAPLASLHVMHPRDPWVATMFIDPKACCSNAAGRIAAHVTRAEAQAELETLSHQFQSQFADEHHSVALMGTSLISRPDAREKALPLVTMFFLAVGSVLLLACANVSNLLLARASARQSEIAVRLSLGAGRKRIIRQLLIESLLLALFGAACSYAMAYFLPAVIMAQFTTPAAPVSLKPDLAVLTYSLLLSVISAVAFGLAPALRGTRISFNDAMKRNNAHATPRFPLRGVLLAVQVCVCIVLLISSGLFLRSVQQAYLRDPGFAVADAAMLSVDLPVNRYSDVQAEQYFAELQKRLEPVATDNTVGMTALAPLVRGMWVTTFSFPGQPPDRTTPVAMQRISAGYFRALKIPVVAGRLFNDNDDQNQAILINQSMARRYWPGTDPVGRVIITGKERRVIVGVVRDAAVYGLGEVDPILFEPFRGSQNAVIVFRDGGLHELALKRAASIARSLEPAAAVSGISMADQMEKWLSPARSGAAMAAILGVLALILSSIGVYGVISYSVEQRRREIGVRLALGAKPREIVGVVIRANATAVLSGLAAGVILSAVSTAAVRRVISGVTPLDPMVWSATAVIVAVAGLLASAIPAHRASRVDPVTALRYE